MPDDAWKKLVTWYGIVNTDVSDTCYLVYVYTILMIAFGISKKISCHVHISGSSSVARHITRPKHKKP